MKKVLLAMAMLLPGADVTAQTAEDRKLADAFRNFLDEEFKHRPLDATRAGDHRFDHLLDDVSPQARQQTRTRLQTVQDRLAKQFDTAALSRDGQIDLEIWRQYLERELWLMDNTRPFEDDPRVYNDYITEGVYLLLTQSTEPKAVNLRNAAARIAQVPAIVEAARNSLKNPPKVVVETAIRQNKGNIAFYETGIYTLAGETPQLSELRQPAQKILPVLRDY